MQLHFDLLQYDLIERYADVGQIKSTDKYKFKERSDFQTYSGYGMANKESMITFVENSKENEEGQVRGPKGESLTHPKKKQAKDWTQTSEKAPKLRFQNDKQQTELNETDRKIHTNTHTHEQRSMT